MAGMLLTSQMIIENIRLKKFYLMREKDHAKFPGHHDRSIITRMTHGRMRYTVIVRLDDFHAEIHHDDGTQVWNLNMINGDEWV